MANPTNMNDTAPGRRDRDVGADLGQHGAEPRKPPSSPNKSKLGDKDVDSVALRANDQGDEQNIGEDQKDRREVRP